MIYSRLHILVEVVSSKQSPPEGGNKYLHWAPSPPWKSIAPCYTGPFYFQEMRCSVDWLRHRNSRRRQQVVQMSNDPTHRKTSVIFFSRSRHLLRTIQYSNYFSQLRILGEVFSKFFPIM